MVVAFPAASVAVTAKERAPGVGEKLYGLVHVEELPPSSAHAYARLVASVAEKVKLTGEVEATESPSAGPSVMPRIGSVRSTASVQLWTTWLLYWSVLVAITG